MFEETLGWRYFSLLQGPDVETDSLQHESVCPLSPLFVNTNEKSNYHRSRLVRVSACPRKWDAQWSWQKSAGKNGTTTRNTAEVRWPWSFQAADWLISVMMRQGHGEAESQWKERDRMSKKRSHGRNCSLDEPRLKRRETPSRSSIWWATKSEAIHGKVSVFFLLFCCLFNLFVYLQSKWKKKHLKKTKTNKITPIYNKCWRGKWTTEVWMRETPLQGSKAPVRGGRAGLGCPQRRLR